jgi:hypothetical protein
LRSTQHVEHVFLVDATNSIQIQLGCSSSTGVMVSLVHPTGIIWSIFSPVSNAQVRVTMAPDEAGPLYWATVIAPTTGAWRLRLEKSAALPAFRVNMTISTDSDLVADASVPGHITAGAPVPVQAVVRWHGTNTSAASMQAEVVAPDGTASNVFLHDDGAHGDEAAGDGIFGAYIHGLVVPGLYHVTVLATGHHPVTRVPYHRAAVERLRVSSPESFIASIPAIEILDISENGMADNVRVDVDFHAAMTGVYRVVGMIENEDQNVRISADHAFVASNAGPGRVSLLFKARELPQGQVLGPFVLTFVALDREAGEWQRLHTFEAEMAVDALMYNEPSRHIRLAGALDFGAVKVGTQAVREITIHNDGWERLHIFELTAPPGFSCGFSGSIDPGESVAVDITFAPTNAASYSGAMTIQSDAAAGEGTVDLAGLGLPDVVSLAEWLSNTNLPPHASGPYDIANSNGIPNLIAYAHNIDPVSGPIPGDTNALPFWRLYTEPGGAHFTVDYRVNRRALGLTFDIESATNLFPLAWWSNVVPTAVQSLGLDPLTGDPRYRATIGVGARPAEFLRLKVTVEE